MRLLQFFLHLFEKPIKRSPFNAGVCYLLVIAAFGVLMALLFAPIPPGTEPISAPVLLVAIFTFGALVIRLCEQAGEWLHPKVSRCRDERHWH